MNIKEIRAITGLSQSKFGEKYNIPLRTIQNWENSVRECADYIKLLLERVVLEDYCYVIKFTENGISRYVDTNGHGYGKINCAKRYDNIEDAKWFAEELIEEYKEQSWNNSSEFSYEILKI